MKMKFKKTLSLFLAVLMIMTVVPFSGMASDTECEHEYEYYPGRPGKHTYYCSKCGDEDLASCSGGTATCGEQKKCEFCDAYYGETLDHDFTETLEEDKYLADAADCQTFKTYYYSCANADCDEKGAETFTSETSKGDHVWDNGTSNGDATCTEDGTKAITCTVEGCGATEDITDENSALGHDFTEQITDEAHLFKAATCNQRAVYFYDCSRCDFNAKDLGEDAERPVFETDYADHLFVIPDAPIEGTGKTPATCTSPAIFYKVCFDCGIPAKGIDENEVYEDGGLAEHVYVNNAQDKYLLSAATCTDKAIYAKSCSECGKAAVVIPDGLSFTDPSLEIYIEGEEIPEGKEANAFRYGEALKHGKTFVSKEANEATCTVDGNTEEVTCDYCKVVLTESQKINKLGHDYADKPIEEYKAPTCKQYGTIGKIECERCKETFAINEKGEPMSIDNLNTFIFALEPLGHEDKDSDMVCDRDNCGSILEPEDLCTCICHGTGIMYFIGLILKWFWKLTGTQPYCQCGIAHYAVD